MSKGPKKDFNFSEFARKKEAQSNNIPKSPRDLNFSHPVYNHVHGRQRKKSEEEFLKDCHTCRVKGLIPERNIKREEDRAISIKDKETVFYAAMSELRGLDDMTYQTDDLIQALKIAYNLSFYQSLYVINRIGYKSIPKMGGLCYLRRKTDEEIEEERKTDEMSNAEVVLNCAKKLERQDLKKEK